MCIRDRYKVQFSTKQLKQIQGYQFTLKVDQVRVDKVQGGVMELEHFGLQGLDQGQITASWNQKTVVGGQWPVDEEPDPLFMIELFALQDARLSQVLSIQERPTAVEAYDAAGNIMEVQLHFTAPTNQPVFESVSYTHLTLPTICSV